MKKYPSTPQEWNRFPVEMKDKELLIGTWQVMQDWELPIMEVLAKEATWNRGDVLEIGFGMGIASDLIIRHGCRSHTIIEAHPVIAAHARDWASKQTVPVTVLEGFWQDIVPDIRSTFDGILFDTYPLQPEERSTNHYSFIPLAGRLLKPDGVLTYYSDEELPFRAAHMELIFKSFREVRLIKVKGLNPPEDCEYWKENYMIIPVCRYAV